MISIYVQRPELEALCRGYSQVIGSSLRCFDYSRALELSQAWQLALEQHEYDPGLTNQKAALRLWQAQQLALLQRWDQASEVLDGLLCRHQNLLDPNLKAQGLILLARIQGLYGEYQQAQQALEQSHIWDPAGRFQATRQVEQARLLAHQGLWEQALEMLSQPSAPLSQLERGKILCRLQRFAEAEQAWQSLLSHPLQLETLDLVQAEALGRLGQLYLSQGQPQQALPLLGNSLRAYWRLRIWTGVIKSYQGLAQACSDLDRPPEALQWTHKAERLSRHLGSELEMAVVYSRLGRLCLKLGNLPQAIRFHKIDVETCRHFEHHQDLAYALLHLGLAYRAQGYHHLACQAFDESLERFLQRGLPSALLTVRWERARTLIERSLLDEADRDLAAASLMLPSDEVTAEACQVNILWGRSQRLRGELQTASQRIQQVQAILEQLPQANSLRCEAWRERGYLELAAGRLEEAARAFTAAVSSANHWQQRALWQECLEQLNRLDEIQGTEALLQGLRLA